MSKKSKPFLAHSEITDCIYIIDGNDKYEVTEQCIKAMKATNRMPRWIPCSERLPEKDGQYICTVKFKHEDGYADEETHAVEYTKDYGGWDMDRFFSDCNPQIIVWMPLPEPYKAGGSDKE